MWTRAARELSTLLLFSNIAEDQAVCVDVVPPELWNDEDDANRDKAKWMCVDVQSRLAMTLIRSTSRLRRVSSLIVRKITNIVLVGLHRCPCYFQVQLSTEPQITQAFAKATN
ncbi:hypothetical protein WCT87_09305 [Pectobacterium brasiliense]|uniref:hypothetical protein n=1 Tax=Pectobacterium brasiliense TaxID=180957 RepID=UPI003017CF46